MPLSGYRSGVFLTLSVSRARDLPSGAMSEGVDLIDIYADEEFNQVRGRGELGDSPGAAGNHLRPLAAAPSDASPWGVAACAASAGSR